MKGYSSKDETSRTNELILHLLPRISKLSIKEGYNCKINKRSLTVKQGRITRYSALFSS